MESFVRSSSTTCLLPSIRKTRSGSGVDSYQNTCLKNVTGFHFPSLDFKKNPLLPRVRKSLTVEAKKNKTKVGKRTFVPRPNEATGYFPEAVLLKERKLREDGRRLPDFADEEEEKVFQALQLEREKYLNTERLRHYEVVYLIHEKHVEEVANVKEKIQEFMREKKAKIWRLNDWGMRRLAYKIQKAKRAYYVLMNFELDAKWVNDFKGMLDRDERVIRHLVMKRDNAETKDCPPPPEFHTIRGYTYADDLDEDDEYFDDDEEHDYDDEDVGEEEHDDGDGKDHLMLDSMDGSIIDDDDDGDDDDDEDDDGDEEHDDGDGGDGLILDRMDDSIIDDKEHDDDDDD